jgi:hypothetical protein
MHWTRSSTLLISACLLGCTETSSAPTVPASAAASFRISPATAAAGLSRLVDIRGYGTDWRPGEVAVHFGDDVDVLSLAVVSEVHVQATVQPTETAPLGSRDVVVTWADRRAIRRDAFGVESGSVSLSPAGAHLGETVRVQLIGHRTLFRSDLTSVSLGEGIRVDDLHVDSETRMTFAAHVSLEAGVGSHDLVVHNAGNDVASLRGAFVVDRTARTFRITPNEAWQGDVLTAVVDVPGLAITTDRTELDLGTGVVITSLEVTAPGEATVELRVGNNALIGPRDVELAFDDPLDLPEDGPVERLLIDGFTVHPVESEGLRVRVSLTHGISRNYNGEACSWDTYTYANASFYEANDFPCPGRSASSTLSAPARWDQFSTGYTTPAVGSTDCPSARTFDAGPFVLMRDSAGVQPDIVLDRRVADFTGRVSYRAVGLIPADYKEDTLYDLVVPGGDLGYQELPPWEVPEALWTLPRDFRQTSPDYCGLRHSLSDPLRVRWETASTYDVADMQMTLNAAITDEGYPILLMYPWDDGVWDFTPEALSFFEPSSAQLSQTASRRTRFDVPGTEISGGGYGGSNLLWRADLELVE